MILELLKLVLAQIGLRKGDLLLRSINKHENKTQNYCEDNKLDELLCRLKVLQIADIR